MWFQKAIFNKLVCTWDISGECNYRCPYCFCANEWERLKRETLIWSVKEWEKFWYRLYEKYGEIWITISGGEPFAYPNFVEIVKRISEFHTGIICTNLSINIEKFIKNCSSKRVRLYPAFHPLFADLREFLKNLELCRKAGFWPLDTVYVAYPPQMKDFEKYRKIFSDNGFSLKKAIFKTRDDWESQDKAEKNNSSEPKDRNSFRHLSAGISTHGYLCDTGMKYFRIHHNGEIVRCAQGTKIGSILDNDISLNENPSLCPYHKCPCEYEFSYCHYPINKYVPVELLFFKPVYLLNPWYLFYRLKTISSFADFKMRFCNLLILVSRIVRGKYKYPLK